MQSAKPAMLFFVLAMLTLSVFAAAVFSPAMGKRAEAQSGPDVSETPKHRVLGASEAAGLREIEVASAAKTETEMRRVAEELQDVNVPEDGTLLIEFKKFRDSSVDTGFALVFDNRDAVLDAGRGETSVQYGEPYDRREARRIMKEEDGMRIVGFKEFAEENPAVWKEARRSLR